MYTLFVDELDQGWQLTHFRALAGYWRSCGWPVAIEPVAAFEIWTAAGGRALTRLHHSMALLQAHIDGRFWALDMHDWSLPGDIAFDAITADPRCVAYLKAQYESYTITGGSRRKIRPWTYFESRSLPWQQELDRWRPLARHQKSLYFRGHAAITEERTAILDYLTDWGIVGETHSISLARYLLELTQHRLMLATTGMAKLCHREIEAFGVGTTVLSPIIKIETHEPLRPNFHYIAVEVDTDRADPYEIAENIAHRYLQVIDDEAFLGYIAANAIAWYDANVRRPQSLALTTRLLGLGGEQFAGCEPGNAAGDAVLSP